MLQHLDVELLVRHDLLQPPILVFELLESLGFFGLHPSVLGPPAMQCRLADSQLFQHRRHVLSGVEHRVRIPQLRHDLLRRIPLAPLLRLRL